MPYVHPWLIPLLQLRRLVGTYAYICDHKNLVYIHPSYINHGSNKLHHLSYRDDLGRLLLYLMTFGEPVWQIVEIVPDSRVEYHAVREQYLDITEHVIKGYNEFLREDPQFTALKLEYTPVTGGNYLHPDDDPKERT